MQPAELEPNEELADYNEECAEGRASDHLLSLISSETDDHYGDKLVDPRLGEQYQAKVPSLLSACERVQLRRNPINSSVGLSIPMDDDTTVLMDPMKHSSEDDMDVAGGFIPFSSPLVPWRDVEERSFLLGLYIFQKDLVQVRKFVGTKNMGDVLSFYYGKFYKSDAHRRWSESRKVKGNKCIHGQRIFAGWRKQELLSRVLPSIPKEVQEKLTEAAKSFTDGRSSLQDFVFTLKDMVGIELLIEAVGIGKGKQDLTGTALDQAKSNQVAPICPKTPVGKAFSSLTYEAIIKLLTGGCRLSKAKSNDLFWEAVWPRLLARGWHSEKPKDLTTRGSKISLVFMVPGINKFSKRKHTRGSQYFDSVKDVLNKVASEPRLLELDSEGANGSDNCNDVDPERDQNDPSCQPRHCYLSPTRQNISPELGMFTVVDTSLLEGEVPFKVRSLQSLPVDAIHTYRASSSASSSSGDSAGSNSEDLVDADVSPNDQQMSGSVKSEYNKFGNTKKWIMGNGVQSDPADPLVSVSKQKLVVNGHDLKNHYSEVLNEKQPVVDTKCQYNLGVKSSVSEHLAPVSKRQRLTGSEYAADDHPSYFSMAYQLKKLNAYRADKPFEMNEIICPEVFCSNRKSTSTSARCSQGEMNECNSHENFSGTGAVCKAVLSQEKSTLFDLNIPQFPPDFDDNEHLCMDMIRCHDDYNPKGPSFSPEAKQEPDASNRVTTVERPTNNARRQGTRNRPPTAKALEAVACGFIGAKGQGSGMVNPADELASRPSRCRRRTNGAPIPAPTSNVSLTGPIVPIVSSKIVGVKEEYNSTTDHVSNIFGKPHAWSDRLYCSEVLD